MTLFSRHPRHPANATKQRCKRWSERVPLSLHRLLGRAPLRRLSQALIIILMLISPLSFSTDKLSNFTYECPVAEACTIKDSHRAAVLYRTEEPQQHVANLSAAIHAQPALLCPPLPELSLDAPSRAPPA